MKLSYHNENMEQELSDPCVMRFESAKDRFN